GTCLTQTRILMLPACHVRAAGRHRGDVPSRTMEGRRVSSRTEEIQTASSPARVPRRLGVHCRAGGVDVAVYAPQARAVDVCFLDDGADGARELRVRLLRGDHGMWTGQVPGIGPGRRYGFRAHGGHDRVAGRAFDPTTLLL